VEDRARDGDRHRPLNTSVEVLLVPACDRIVKHGQSMHRQCGLTELLSDEAPVVCTSYDLDHCIPNADILPPIRVGAGLEEILRTNIDLLDDLVVELTHALRQVTLDHDIEHVVVLNLGVLEGVLKLLALKSAVACTELLLRLAGKPVNH
jgi:hypothetical protein